MSYTGEILGIMAKIIRPTTIYSSSSPPPNPAVNQLFYETTIDVLWFYTGSEWQSVAEYVISSPSFNSQNNGSRSLMSGVHPNGSKLYVTSVQHVINFNALEQTTTAYWTFDIEVKDTSGATSTKGSVSSQSTGTYLQNRWYTFTIPGTPFYLDPDETCMVDFTRTGTTSNIYSNTYAYYRLVR